ncbi:unnamed protein product [Mytilus coruscus]|uniref:Uncharacterized protein n=1 Tax=Mytilus coruscus TaxID=42192 RepID=A0A6J8F279_MYTCO|nr:unnamed protein product [Mytilus coruscus]
MALVARLIDHVIVLMMASLHLLIGFSKLRYSFNPPKKRNQSTCCSDTLQFRESVNSPQQGETHEYEEVAVDLQNRESSMNGAQDVSSSSSLTGGSGICGTDSDGYLNPYHTPKSTSTTLEHGPYSELSNTETSFMHVLESPVYSKSQTKNLEIENRDKRNT